MRYVDVADLAILINVESLRDQSKHTWPSTVADTIGGAPWREVASRLAKMYQLGLLERVDSLDNVLPVGQGFGQYAVSVMGAEFAEMNGWSPSKREDRRRARQVEQAVNARSR